MIDASAPNKASSWNLRRLIIYSLCTLWMRSSFMRALVSTLAAGYLGSALVPSPTMVTLRVVRHDRHEQVLAECQSDVIPARGEVVQLDTIDRGGEMTRPSTMWRVVSVTLHVPSLASQSPSDGTTLAVRRVEVAVLPDV